MLYFLYIFFQFAEVLAFIFLVTERRKGLKILRSLATLAVMMAGAIICNLLIAGSRSFLWVNVILFLPVFALLVYKTVRLGKTKSTENFRFKSAMVL